MKIAIITALLCAMIATAIALPADSGTDREETLKSLMELQQGRLQGADRQVGRARGQKVSGRARVQEDGRKTGRARVAGASRGKVQQATCFCDDICEDFNDCCYYCSPPDCLDEIYVLGFTSGLTNADSDTSHKIEICTDDGETRCVNLPDLPGDDYTKNKGDLWKIEITDFNFPGCITIRDIASIAIIEGGNDGWNIDSICTFFKSNPDSYELASLDFDVERWIDGDGPPSYERFNLTLCI